MEKDIAESFYFIEDGKVIMIQKYSSTFIKELGKN